MLCNIFSFFATTTTLQVLKGLTLKTLVLIKNKIYIIEMWHMKIIFANVLTFYNPSTMHISDQETNLIFSQSTLQS